VKTNNEAVLQDKLKGWKYKGHSTKYDRKSFNLCNRKKAKNLNNEVDLFI
jgi:hypothetical protein